ncbi:MAG TPA: LptA/OstA family protein [Chitinispirillaceae bacterium]|nr:LptA/OstA family protein [Chitinispirillaceae bacterium]
MCVFRKISIVSLSETCMLMFTVYCLIFFTQSSAASTQKKKESGDLVLESANSNENTYTNGEFVSILRGNVVFTYDDTRIKSDEATWWRSQGILQFRNNIFVTNKSQKLSCDRMNYTKKNNLLTASGRFRYIDTLEQAELTGNDAEYYLDEKRFFLKGNPKLIRYDTASAETLTIVGKTMTYTDSIKKATVAENVVITKGKLVSKCNTAHYFTESNMAWLREKPDVIFDRSTVNGDSINLYFGKESLKKAAVYGKAKGIYVDTIPKSTDTSYTHINGDSLIITISDSGSVDSLWTYGKAHSEYYSSKDRQTKNEADGKAMVMAFGERGSVSTVNVAGNARSRYFIEEKDSKGINEASGDSITVRFRNGKASQLVLKGSARGTYIPQDLTND